MILRSLAGGTLATRALAPHPSWSVEGRRAGTETAATRQCPAFTAASANHSPAPPGPARRHRPRLGPEKTRPLGGHLRPSRGRARGAPTAPRPEEGARGAGAAAPPRDMGRAWRAGCAAHSGRTRRGPFKTSLLPGPRGASCGPAAGGSDIRATGLATTTAPRAAPSPCGTPDWPRLGSAAGARSSGCRSCHALTSSVRATSVLHLDCRGFVLTSLSASGFAPPPSRHCHRRAGSLPPATPPTVPRGPAYLNCFQFSEAGEST
ncbi:nascent polypeptide-associated complex subunit alpha, muscle-specific form-like [Mustela lutreola]|uniref:nascent polypeptide-associated complex subunit alpha, muscle-specific form-like n=1 Tax=Mustela lutreola TaxID=9666 RepID=UPI002797AEDD|nr:nascent polypeptide-associated complex subunit alpha, muscle-specific form-like [Mustela lutreola]